MLELVLKSKWYNAIDNDLPDAKREEYRDLTPYWWTRIFTSPSRVYEPLQNVLDGGYDQKHYTVRFRLGYGSNAKQMIWRIGHCSVGQARQEWSEDGTGKCIVIPLRDRLSEPALLIWKKLKQNERSFGEKIVLNIHQDNPDFLLFKELEKFRLIKCISDDFDIFELV